MYTSKTVKWRGGETFAIVLRIILYTHSILFGLSKGRDIYNKSKI